MTVATIARLFGYTLGWMFAGLVMSYVLVWHFVDADMVLPYFVLGAMLGSIAGAIFALVTQRTKSVEKASWSRVLLRAAVSGTGATAVIATIWLTWADARIDTPFSFVLLVGALTVGFSVILGGLSSLIERLV